MNYGNRFDKVRLGIGGMVCLLAIFLMISTAGAAEGFEPETKTVIQVSSDDPVTQRIALNNAVNLQEAVGMDNVRIEIVAYGPGLGLLTKSSQLSERVKNMSMQNIRFSACENTMAAVERKTGRKPELTEGVGTVKSGVARIVELQGKGYAYVRP